MRMSSNITITCEHEVDKRSSSGTEYMHVRIPTCMHTLYATFYVYYILYPDGQDNIECNHMLNSIQII